MLAPPFPAIITDMTATPMTDPQPIIDPEREAKRRAVVEGWDSIEREGVIAHADMMAWLESWDTANELPPPEPKPWK